MPSLFLLYALQVQRAGAESKGWLESRSHAHARALTEAEFYVWSDFTQANLFGLQKRHATVYK